MSQEIVCSAYKTRLGNPVAKTILALVADQVGWDGFGGLYIRSIHEEAEVSERAVECHLQAFEEIGLLKREQWRNPAEGNRLNVTVQFSLLKLGTDLRKEFAAALERAQAKASPVAPEEMSPLTHAGMSAATFPPNPVLGGTVIERLREPERPQVQAQKQPQGQLLPKKAGSDGDLIAAARLLDKLGIASSPYDVRIVSQVIAYAARDASCEVQDATKALESAARAAMARGELVNVFWFKDRKFAKGAGEPSKAKQRLDRNRRAIADALAEQGIPGPWDADGADGAAEIHLPDYERQPIRQSTEPDMLADSATPTAEPTLQLVKETCAMASAGGRVGLMLDRKLCC